MSIEVTLQANGSALYVTREGDMLDHICWRYYGREWNVTEAALQVNSELAALGPVLPAGLALVLPRVEVAASPSLRRIRLFD